MAFFFVIKAGSCQAEKILKTFVFADVEEKKTAAATTKPTHPSKDKKQKKQAECGIFFRTNSDTYKENLCYSQT